MLYPRIAVVGGGIFGVTGAAVLAQNGYHVDLFERNNDLLSAASGINQYRLHRGYHYPRSAETAASCLESEALFVSEYGETIVDGIDHYYCVAASGSKTSPAAFVAFCERMGLGYEEAPAPVVRADAVALSLRVEERLFDPNLLRATCWRRLRQLPVRVHLGVEFTPADLARYELVVVATYAGINSLLGHMPDALQEYQYEVCEKPVVRLPSTYRGQSAVVIDGPFMCVDPYGMSDLFVLGNVVHAIHQTNVGHGPDVDPALRELLDRGVVAKPPITRFPRFIEAAARFFRDIERAEHVGSMFTIRAVPAYKDDTDERPTILRRVNDRLVTVFSGKIVTCVQSAHELVRMAKEMGIARDPAVRYRRESVAMTPEPDRA